MQNPFELRIGERFVLRSQILDEERSYWVHLPASYASASSHEHRYPVLYLLGGESLFHSAAAGMVPLMSSGNKIPELIIVAVPDTNGIRDLTPTTSMVDAVGRDRSKWEDSGGGQTFLEFFRNELFPEIESRYRTLPHRTLVGLSIGGLFALQSVLDAPETFQAHIAIDPSLWWDQEVLVARVQREIKKSSERRGSVYISLANNRDYDFGPVMKRAGLAFAESLKMAATENFRTAHEYFQSEDHRSIPLPSLYQGLLFTFQDYKPSLTTSAPSLIAHFERLSDRHGVQLLPPETLVNQMGFMIIDQVVNENQGSTDLDLEKAIDLFQLNIRNYPRSSIACDSLGLAYEVKRDRTSAIKYYERSLELNPENENAKELLEKLRR